MPAAALLHTLQVTRSSYSAERAKEVLLQDYTGAARMLPNCTATFLSFRLPDCTREQPKQPTRWWRLLLLFSSRKPIFLNIIIIHLFQSYIHCDLDHSCSKLHNTIFIFPARRKILPPKREIVPSPLLATLLNFKSPAGVEEVTWPGKWRGDFYSWINPYLL